MYKIWVEYSDQWAHLNPSPIGDEPSFILRRNALKRAAKLQRFHEGIAQMLKEPVGMHFFVKDRKDNRYDPEAS